MSAEPTGCVVIPFGVPVEGAGLGLGLAAVVHSSARIAGGGVAIVRLQATQKGGAMGPSAAPVEVFMTPDAWRDMARRGDGPSGIGMVLTGAFEPPVDGDGAIRLLAFDPRDGTTRATTDARVDGEHAGEAVVGALERLCSQVGGEIGALSGLRELSWEALESVLRAERCALHDPARGGPHDGLAAMLHFGRAIGDAPDARYPATRLVAIALDTASGPPHPSSLASAALRALESAAADASSPFELVEALGALLLRLGKVREAERRMNAAIEAFPDRSRPYAILCQALRAQGNLEGALASVEAGLARARGDAALHVERGAVLAACGNADGALASWRRALELDPLSPGAFGPVAAFAIRSHDTTLAQSLIDVALAATGAHPDVSRSAIQLLLESEAEGLARAARLAKLCQNALERNANDAWVLLVSARALLTLGQRSEARARLEAVERMAPKSGPAAEAQIARLSIDNPGASLELESVTRAALGAPLESLAEIASRARRLAAEHGVWRGWLAAAVAEGRRNRWNEARANLEIALEIAPGAGAAHLEMARVLLALGRGEEARGHVESAISSEGPSPQAVAVLTSVLAAAAAPSKRRSWTDRLRRVWNLRPGARNQRYVKSSS
jgi:tetratricopeptide (TPR) repeat protein